MTSQAFRVRAPAASDLIQLTKPRILSMSLVIMAVGMYLAPGSATYATWLWTLLGTGLIVGAANTLNMYVERDIDGEMSRTRNRPLPAGRMHAVYALIFGIAQATVAIPVLAFGVNALTAVLAAVSLVLYVLVYTPLKQRTTLATAIGAIPGAAPPLMGWTAQTASLDAGGLALFAVVFFWQLPHFHAIALYRMKEYTKAGLVTLPARRGERATRRSMMIFLAAQTVASVALVPLEVAGTLYLIVALALGVAYVGCAVRGLATSASAVWGRSVFRLSVVYLPLMFLAMMLDGVLS